mgnify:CR=1 FL=1
MGHNVSSNVMTPWPLAFHGGSETSKPVALPETQSGSVFVARHVNEQQRELAWRLNVELKRELSRRFYMEKKRHGLWRC